jgi:adenylate cyclase
VSQEIERRFLLCGLPIIPDDAEVIKIKQGYFESPVPHDEVRIRIASNGTREMTAKIGIGIERGEYNQRFNTLEVAEVFFSICAHKLEKTRHRINGWEVDVFKKPLNGIVLAEKELTHICENLIMPEWIEAMEPLEVTDSLSNIHLARLASDLAGGDVLALPFVHKMIRRIPIIAIDGPPCAGKSTVIQAIKDKFPDVHFVPEAATVIIAHLGIYHSNQDQMLSIPRQRAIYRTQKIFEATSMHYALAMGKKAIVVDRGAVSAAAYMIGGTQQFEETFRTSLDRERKNYDAVIFLHLPPENVYDDKFGNNPARYETYEQAYATSCRLYEAWHKHSRFHEIFSYGDWQDKEDAVIACLKSIL